MLSIQWRTHIAGERYSFLVATGYADLRVSMQANVIVGAQWCLPSGQSCHHESVQQQAIKRYLQDPDSVELHVFFHRKGTAFSQQVWRALLNIAFGETVTYGALARQVNSGARAVANACRQNPYPGFIPCHRVVASNDAGGFMGQRSGKMVDLKCRILSYESATATRKSSIAQINRVN